MSNDKLREAAQRMMDWADSCYYQTDSTAELIAVKAQLREALAASKPEPQAQAGEPAPVQFYDHPDFVGGIKWSDLELKWIAARDQQWLQSHREAMAEQHEIERQLSGQLQAACEAIAEKDAALQACVEALENLNATVWGECPSLLNEDSGGNSVLAMDIEDAITQAKEALK